MHGQQNTTKSSNPLNMLKIGIDLGRAIAILTLIFQKLRRETIVWGQFGAECQVHRVT